MKRLAAILCTILILFQMETVNTYASIPDLAAEVVSAAISSVDGPQIQAPEAILMEASTGTVIYEKNADEAKNPASVTKIMTLLLIFDALHSGKIKLTDEVVTSAHAKSMGGSQVFLEEGEIQTVETLIKCIVIASGNDASVVMAELIGGDEGTFVNMMNERAKGLGMTSAHFEDCCGLTDSTTHAMSARDIALMTRELIIKYPEIFNYSTIWMENITHVTKQGSKEFGLSNTNKLLKMATNFEVTGLKTGSTSLAKYCLSATARKDGVELIAVILAAPDFKIRFGDARTLLNFGYANCRMYRDEEPGSVPDIPIIGGVKDTAEAAINGIFSYLSMKGEDFGGIEKEWIFTEPILAPVTEGDILGYLVYRLNGEEIGRIDMVAIENVRKANFSDALKRVWKAMMVTENDG
ncbi:MAG: D-alanyl-D-alanine carboxypeptidase family protein [Clostridium sp.]